MAGAPVLTYNSRRQMDKSALLNFGACEACAHPRSTSWKSDPSARGKSVMTTGSATASCTYCVSPRCGR